MNEVDGIKIEMLMCLVIGLSVVVPQIKCMMIADARIIMNKMNNVFYNEGLYEVKT